MLLDSGDEDLNVERELSSFSKPSRSSSSNRYHSFAQRYVGHSNVQTDIKEATFWKDFIISGSDDGHIFIWQKRTGRLVKILKASEEVINCVRGHPTENIIMASGIDADIKMFTPSSRPFDKDDNIEDIVLLHDSTVSNTSQSDTASEPASIDSSSTTDEMEKIISANQSRVTAGLPRRFLINEEFLTMLLQQYGAQLIGMRDEEDEEEGAEEEEENEAETTEGHPIFDNQESSEEDNEGPVTLAERWRAAQRGRRRRQEEERESEQH